MNNINHNVAAKTKGEKRWALFDFVRNSGDYLFWGEATGLVKRSLPPPPRKTESRAEEKTWWAFSRAAKKTNKSVYDGYSTIVAERVGKVEKDPPMPPPITMPGMPLFIIGDCPPSMPQFTGPEPWIDWAEAHRFLAMPGQLPRHSKVACCAP